ncbi:MAG TPA: flagellar basal-body rod protein FlgF [Rhodospirillaceae bacterium]|nr:flagellar basal-body rod protein FlgF [Rhodospirillaceae bacterium]
MESSLYVGLSRQIVLSNAMTMVANNVANANTAGYRAQNPMFQEYISKERYDKDDLSMVYDMGQYDTTSPGTIQLTGNPYDVALNGPGFMAVTSPSGEMQYTRSGNFTVNNNNELVTSSGYKVSGPGGDAIAIPTSAREVKITDQGEVTADGNTVGRIGVFEFDNLQELRPEGNGLYSAKTPGRPATETKMIQGSLEGSNVNAIQETTRMIEILRTYQSTMRMIQNEQERQVSAITTLAKING